MRIVAPQGLRGRLIGRGGVEINKLEAESGARVDFKTDSDEVYLKSPLSPPLASLSPPLSPPLASLSPPLSLPLASLSPPLSPPLASLSLPLSPPLASLSPPLSSPLASLSPHLSLLSLSPPLVPGGEYVASFSFSSHSVAGMRG